MANLAVICATVSKLRREIKMFIDGSIQFSESEVKLKLKDLKNCINLFKEGCSDVDDLNARQGLDGIQNAYLVSLRELEEHGIFKEKSSTAPNSHKPGRPKKIIDIEKVKMLKLTGMTFKKIAECQKVSYSKVYSTVKDATGSAPSKMVYSNLSETELDGKLSDFEREHGRHGRRMTEGYLRGQGVILANAKTKIKESNERRNLEPLSVGHRLKRRTYKVRGPGSLCHIDTHHKLGRRYGIIIHAAVDGFSKLCVYARASNQNNSETALNFFLEGCESVIMPSRIRTDKGTENVKIWAYMTELRGSSHKPVLKGPSVNNTRIERWWGYLTQGGIVTKYKELFGAMEDAGHLNLDEDNEMFLLHLVYLPKIDRELKMFVRSYNQHRIEGHGIPTEVFLRGCYEKYGIQSPRLTPDLNVAEFDVSAEDLEGDYGNIGNDDFTTRREEHEPVVRHVFLTCSELQKVRLMVKLADIFGDIECYSSTNVFSNLSNLESEAAFLRCKNILVSVLLDQE